MRSEVSRSCGTSSSPTSSRRGGTRSAPRSSRRSTQRSGCSSSRSSTHRSSRSPTGYSTSTWPTLRTKTLTDHMTARTKNFNELRERARQRDPDWDANVAERQRAIEDALALAELRQSRQLTQVQLAEQLGISQGNVS